MRYKSPRKARLIRFYLQLCFPAILARWYGFNNVLDAPKFYVIFLFWLNTR